MTATLRLEPASAGEGIVFVRADLPGHPAIAVAPENVKFDQLQRMTVLEAPRQGAEPIKVAMVEHLLAACAGLGVTDLRVILHGWECPIFDGSALPYIELIEKGGMKTLDRPIAPWRLRRPVILHADRADLVALPAERMRLTFFAEFSQWGMDDEQVTFEPGRDDFSREIAPARTFCFWEDIEQLVEQGLIKGGSLENAIVLRDGKPMNGKYRLQSELARHKLLDLLGDLAVLGRPVAALISARATGHALHHQFIRLLLKELYR